MGSSIALAIFFVFVSSVSFNALALPTFAANDDGTISVLLDPEEYDNLGDDVWSAMQTKRFWSPHPSDYNPLRRPVPVPRGSKRDNENTPYHPIPRGVTMKQRSLGHSGDETSEAYEAYLDGGRQKKQTRAATLIFRLGSWGLRRKTDKNVVPITPPPNTSS